MGRMDGRVAVVTGASSGIGRATAMLLAAEGADVALVALPGTELDEAALECARSGRKAIAIPADVSDSKQVAAAFNVAETLGPVSAVFNNAGKSSVIPLTETEDKDWFYLLGTNLTGSFFVIREAIRRMQPRRYGAIVNTGSDLAFLGQAGYCAYSATKGGVLALTRAVADEVAPLGIRVNAVCPGATNTPLLMAEFTHVADPEAERKEMEQTIAMGRFGEPRELARAVLFLLSDEASYVTGAHLAVDGGRTTCFASGTIFRSGLTN